MWYEMLLNDAVMLRMWGGLDLIPNTAWSLEHHWEPFQAKSWVRVKKKKGIVLTTDVSEIL